MATPDGAQRRRVLLIDDEPDLLDILKAHLEQAGYQVTCAQSGREAVEHAQRQRFDLTISDFKMPGMDGLQTLAALVELDPTTRTVLMTGYTSDEVRAAMSAGGAHLIEKPFDVTELLDLLRRALGRP
jgi:DNA-binding NtrC family response regulator